MRICGYSRDFGRGFLGICEILGEDLWGFTRIHETLGEDLWEFMRL